MGITSINNLTNLPLPRSLGSEMEPPPMEKVENSARTGDDAYSPSNGKSARGSEDDASEDELEDQPEEAESESSTQPAALPSTSQISFFA